MKRVKSLVNDSSPGKKRHSREGSPEQTENRNNSIFECKIITSIQTVRKYKEGNEQVKD